MKAMKVRDDIWVFPDGRRRPLHGPGCVQPCDGWWHEKQADGGWKKLRRVRLDERSGPVPDPTRTRAGASAWMRLMYHRF